MEEFVEFFGDVIGAHEGFADEQGVEIGGDELLDIGAGFDATFGDEDFFVVDEFAELEGVVEIDVHGFEVAVIDAEQAAGELGVVGEVLDALEGLGFVDFEQDGEVERVSGFEQLGELIGGEGFGDEEDGVGAGSTGLDNLVRIDDEILAEDRQGDGVFDQFEILEFSLEEMFVGKDADGVGAGVLVDLGERVGLEIGSDYAGRG